MKKILFFLLLSLSFKGYCVKYTVTLATDNTVALPGELRYALQQADNNPGLDTVVFNIPAQAPVTINIVNRIYISYPVFIDGSSQPANGYLGIEPKISLQSTSSGDILFAFWSNHLSNGNDPSGSTISDITFSFYLAGANGRAISVLNANYITVKNCVFMDLFSAIEFEDKSDYNIVKGNYFGTNKAKTINGTIKAAIIFMAAHLGEEPNGNIVGGNATIDINYFYNSDWPLVGVNSAAIKMDVGFENKINNNVFVNNKANIKLVNGSLSNNGKTQPIFTKAEVIGTNIKLTGTSVAGDYIEVYQSNNAGIDAELLVGSAVANASGVWDFTISKPASLNVGGFVIATATDPTGNTSEFCFKKIVSQGTQVPASNCSSCTEFDFYFPNKICANEHIVFEKSLVACQNNPSVIWDFGDGSPISASSEHTYTSSGPYTVTMSIQDVCTQSKTINVVACPEFACGSISPCTALGLNATINLESSPQSNPTAGTYTYKVVPSSPSYVGTYTYLWTISPNIPNVSYIVSGANSNSVNIVKTASSGPILLTVTATTTDGSNCYITKTFDPCANFNFQIGELAFSIPTASYGIIPQLITTNHSFVWSVSSTPAGAYISSTPTPDVVNIAGISNNPSATDGVSLSVQSLVKEINNGSNGCSALVSKDFSPCQNFKPLMVYDGVVGTDQYRYSIQTPIASGAGPYTYNWSITYPTPVPTTMGLVGSTTSNDVIVYYDSSGPVVHLTVVVTDINGKKCSAVSTWRINDL